MATVLLALVGCTLGSAIAVAGLPAGTWLGQLAGWRAAFVGLAVVGIVALGLVVAHLPDARPHSPDAAARSRPAGRYLLLVSALALLVTGSFTFFTYLSPYLTGVAVLSAGAVAAVLLVRGAFGVIGVWLGGVLVDRRPGLASTLPAAAQAVALLGLFAIPNCPFLVVVLTGVTGLAFSMVSTVGASRIPQIAPVTSISPRPGPRPRSTSASPREPCSAGSPSPTPARRHPPQWPP